MARLAAAAGVDSIEPLTMTGRNVRRYRVHREGAAAFDIEIVVGPTGDAVASSVVNKSTQTVQVTVSERAALRAVGRALAHEIAEAAAILDGQTASPDLFTATGPLNPDGPSPHDRGRLAEIRYLFERRESRNPLVRRRAEGDLGPLLDHVGLRPPTADPAHDGSPGYAARLPWVPADVRRALAQWPGTDAQPTLSELWIDRPWEQQGRRPSWGELVTRTAGERFAAHSAIQQLVGTELEKQLSPGVRIESTVDVRPNRTAVTSVLVDAAGVDVGAIRTSIQRQPDGELRAHHQLAESTGDPALSRYLIGFDEWLRESGVAQTRGPARASGNVGLAFAEAGYDWRPADGWYPGSGDTPAAHAVMRQLGDELRLLGADAAELWLGLTGDNRVDLDALLNRYRVSDPQRLYEDLARYRAAAEDVIRPGLLEPGDLDYPSPGQILEIGRDGRRSDRDSWLGERALRGIEWNPERLLGPAQPARAPVARIRQVIVDLAGFTAGGLETYDAHDEFGWGPAGPHLDQLRAEVGGQPGAFDALVSRLRDQAAAAGIPFEQQLERAAVYRAEAGWRPMPAGPQVVAAVDQLRAVAAELRGSLAEQADRHPDTRGFGRLWARLGEVDQALARARVEADAATPVLLAMQATALSRLDATIELVRQTDWVIEVDRRIDPVGPAVAEALTADMDAIVDGQRVLSVAIGYQPSTLTEPATGAPRPNARRLLDRAGADLAVVAQRQAAGEALALRYVFPSGVDPAVAAALEQLTGEGGARLTVVGERIVGTAAAVPGSDFHGRRRRTPRPGVIGRTAERWLERTAPGVVPLGGRTYQVAPAVGVPFTVTLRTGDTGPDGAVATVEFDRGPDGRIDQTARHAVVTVSDRALTRSVGRALAHELAEASAVFAAALPVPPPATATYQVRTDGRLGLTPHGLGRQAEIRALHRLRTSNNPYTRWRAGRDLDPLLRHLGLDQPADVQARAAFERRLAAYAADVAELIGAWNANPADVRAAAVRSRAAAAGRARSEHLLAQLAAEQAQVAAWNSELDAAEAGRGQAPLSARPTPALGDRADFSVDTVSGSGRLRPAPRRVTLAARAALRSLSAGTPSVELPDGRIQLAGPGGADPLTVRVRAVPAATLGGAVARATVSGAGAVTLEISDQTAGRVTERAVRIALDQAGAYRLGAPTSADQLAPGPSTTPVSRTAFTPRDEARVADLTRLLDQVQGAAFWARPGLLREYRAALRAAGLDLAAGPARRAALDPELAGRIAALDPLPSAFASPGLVAARRVGRLAHVGRSGAPSQSARLMARTAVTAAYVAADSARQADRDALARQRAAARVRATLLSATLLSASVTPAPAALPLEAHIDPGLAAALATAAGRTPADVATALDLLTERLRRLAVARPSNRAAARRAAEAAAAALGLRYGALDAAAGRALLPAALSSLLAERVDDRRPVPDPQAVVATATSVVDPLSAATGLTVRAGGRTGMLELSVPTAAGLVPVTVEVGTARVASGVVAEPERTGPDTAVIRIDDRAGELPIRVAVAGALAEIAAQVASTPNGPRQLRPGAFQSSTIGLVTEDQRALGELRAALGLAQAGRAPVTAINRAAGRQTRAERAGQHAAAELVDVLAAEFGMGGTGPAAVARRGLLDPAHERAVATRQGEPAPVVRARQVIALLARPAGSAWRGADGTVTLRVNGQTTRVVLTPLAGVSGRDAGEVSLRGDLASGLTLAIPVRADEAAVARSVARLIGPAVAELAGRPDGPGVTGTHPLLSVPGPDTVTRADAAVSAELRILAEGLRDGDRVAVAATDELLATARLRPIDAGGAARYQALRDAGLLPDPVHAALDPVRAIGPVQRELAEVARRAAELAGASRAVLDGAVLRLDAPPLLVEVVADQQRLPGLTRAAGELLTVSVPRFDQRPGALDRAAVAVARAVATAVATQTDPANRVQKVREAELATLLHRFDAVGRHPRALRERATELIRELDLRHDTAGSRERRALLDPAFQAALDRYDGAPGAWVADLRVRLRSELARDASLDVHLDPADRNRIELRVGQRSLTLSVFRGELADGVVAELPDTQGDQHVLVLDERASQERREHAAIRLATEWARFQTVDAVTGVPGPVRRRLPFDPIRWSARHHAAVASLRRLVEQYRATPRGPLRLALKVRLELIGSELGVHPRVAGSAQRLRLLTEAGLLDADHGSVLRRVGAPRRSVRSAIDQIGVSLFAAQRQGLLEDVQRDGDLFRVTTVHPGGGRRTFTLDVVAGVLALGQDAELAVDSDGRAASVTINQRNVPVLRSKRARTERIARAAAGELAALLAQQPPPGVEWQPNTAAHRFFAGAVLHGPETADLSVADQVRLSQLGLLAYQYQRAAREASRYGRFTRAGRRANRLGHALDREIRALGLSVGEIGVEHRRAQLSDRVRTIVAERDGARGSADRAAALADAAAVLPGVAAVLGLGPIQVTADRLLVAGTEFRLHADTVETGQIVAGTGTDLVINERAGRAEIERALARALATRLASPHGGGPTNTPAGGGWLRPGATPSGPGTADDLGRMAELSLLDRQLNRAMTPLRRAGLRRELRALTSRLGLDRDAPGVAGRRRLLTAQALAAVERTDPAGRHTPAATTRDAAIRDAATRAAVTTALSALGPAAGVREVQTGGRPGLFDIILADAPALPLRVAVTTPGAAGQSGGGRLGRGQLADGRYERAADGTEIAVLEVSTEAFTRLDSRAGGLAARAALVREIARIAAERAQAHSGQPAPTPVLRPGVPTGTDHRFAPADAALAAELRYLADQYRADASRAERRWIVRRIDALARSAGLTAGNPGADLRRSLLPATAGTLMAELAGEVVLDQRERVAEAALTDLAAAVGVGVSTPGPNRYELTLADGSRVEVRLYVDALPAGVVARLEPTEVGGSASAASWEFDVSETASPARIRAAVTRELSAALAGLLAAQTPSATTSGVTASSGRPAAVVNEELRALLSSGRLADADALVRYSAALPSTTPELSAADRAALTELWMLDQLAAGSVGRPSVRWARRSAAELVERLGLGHGQPGAEQRWAALPSGVRALVAAHDPNRTTRSAASNRRLINAALLDAVRAWNGPAASRSDRVTVVRTGPAEYTLRTAAGHTVGLAVRRGDPGGGTAVESFVGPDGGTVLQVAADAAGETLGPQIADQVADLLAPLPGATPAGLVRFRLLAERAGYADRPTLTSSPGAELELRLLAEQLGVAADLPDAVALRHSLPDDVRRVLDRLDGRGTANEPAVLDRVADVLGSAEFAQDADVRPATRVGTGDTFRVPLESPDAAVQTTLRFQVLVANLRPGQTSRVDPAAPGTLIVARDANPADIEVALARFVAERAAVERGVLASRPAGSQLRPGPPPIVDPHLTAAEMGEQAQLRVLARQAVLGGVTRPALLVDALLGRAALRRLPGDPRLAAAAARLGLLPGQRGAVARSAVLGALARDGQRPTSARLALGLGRLDDAWDRAARQRAGAARPTGVPSPGTYIRKAYLSSGVGSLVTAVAVGVHFRPKPPVSAGHLVGTLLALGAVLPPVVGLGEYYTRTIGQRRSDRKAAGKRGAVDARRRSRALTESQLERRLDGLSARLDQLGVPALSTDLSRRVPAPSGPTGLDPHAAPVSDRRQRSAVASAPAYLLKTAPGPAASAAAWVLGAQSTGNPRLAGASVVAGPTAGVTGLFGEWIKYADQEREGDRDADRQFDRDRGHPTLDPTVAAEPRAGLVRSGAGLRARVERLAVRSGLTPAQPATQARSRRPVSRSTQARVEDVSRPWLASYFPSWPQYYLKAATSPSGLGLFIIGIVGAVRIHPIAALVGFGGALVAPFVHSAGESHLHYGADAHKNERERAEAELEVTRAAQRAEGYDQVIDHLSAVARNLAALRVARGQPAPPLPSPPRLAAPAGHAPPARGRPLGTLRVAVGNAAADVIAVLRGRKDGREFLHRTVWADLAYGGGFGVIWATFGQATAAYLVPALLARAANWFYSPADALADQAEKQRASVRSAAHGDRIAAEERYQAAQREAIDDLVSYIEVALNDLPPGGTLPPPAIPPSPAPPPVVTERDDAIRAALAASQLTTPDQAAVVAAGYDVAAQWTGPYLVAAVDQLLYQLRQQTPATAAAAHRFLLLGADDVVYRIAHLLAPDFVGPQVVWAPTPVSPADWDAVGDALRVHGVQLGTPGSAVTVIADDPAGSLAAQLAAGYPASGVTARALLPNAPGSRLVSQLHGLGTGQGAIPPQLAPAVRAVSRAAVASVVRATLLAGPQAGRATLYRTAAQLDQQVVLAPDQVADPLLAWWLRHLL